jgi:hypothetical protein
MRVAAAMLVGDTHVGENQIDQVAILLALAQELDRQDAQPLLEQLAAIRGPERAADVGRVRDRAREADQMAAMEDRRGHRDVRQMPGREPWIVGDDAIARTPLLDRNALEARSQRARQDAHERWDAGRVLRERIAAAVHQHRGEIVRFAHDGGKRGAHQRGRRLIGDRDEPVPENLQRDGIEIRAARSGHARLLLLAGSVWVRFRPV